MHARFRVRYIILLLCTVTLVCWISFWSIPSADKCSGNTKLCSYTDDLVRSASEVNLVYNTDSNDGEKLMIGMIKDENDENARRDGYEKYAFNELISVRIGYHREIPDTRHNMCKSLVYSDHLPMASVVICFHNEAWSTLLRTVHSVLDRTPDSLLHEIILVDDFSSEENLKESLDRYISKLSKVFIVRTIKREGLIRGRALGASKASGHVLVFLDSHCEVNVGWLPPLLEPISKKPQTVVCPLIDIISSDTFQYSASPLVKGGFNWGLHFQWEPVSTAMFKKPEDFVKPIRSPTMAGGLFAIQKNYFDKLGHYDYGMEIWGGENLEISFRIWMCGGELQVVPCSRVGHVFRNRRPYGSDGKGDTMSYNSMRVAEVWMDEYKKHFYNVRRELNGKPFGDVSQRQELRRRLKCKSFKWFLYNVYTEIDIPHERKGTSLLWQRPMVKEFRILREGKLRNSEDYCLDMPDDHLEKGAKLVLSRCDQVSSKNTWSLNDAGQLKLRGKLCVDVKKPHSPRLMKCIEGGSQQWILVQRSQFLYNPANGMCLSDFSNKPVVAICNSSDMSQEWMFLVNYSKQYNQQL